MQPYVESVLFRDPQAQIPAGFCPVCGRELYAPSMECLFCRMENRP